MHFGRPKITLFSSTLPTQEEIESLPAFPRGKLTLRLLLGSGAFGEVYEGTAVDILGVGSGETKVAVKGMWLFANTSYTQVSVISTQRGRRFPLEWGM